MDHASNVKANAAAAQNCCAPAGKSRWLNSRNVLIGVLALGGAGTLIFGWNWLVAAGFASVIVGVLPCLIMCALGICASRMGRKDAAPTASVPAKEADIQATATIADTVATAPEALKTDDRAPQPAKGAA